MKLRVAPFLSSIAALPWLAALCLGAPAGGLAQERDQGDHRGGDRPATGGAFGRRDQGGRGFGGFRFPGAPYGPAESYGRRAYPPPAGYGRDGYEPPGYGRGYSPGGGSEPYPYDGRYASPGSLDGDWRAQQNEVRQAVREGRHIPLGQAIAAVRRRTPGRELDAGLEPGPGGRSVYRLRWAAANGRRIDYLIDAATGAVIGVQGGR